MFIQMYEEKFMRFPEGRAKALTFSYDDGVKADKKLIEIFNAHGLKGTFNLNSKLFDCECWHGKMGEEETYKVFSAAPHEIALHGARHIFMDKVPLPEAVNEVVQNRLYLENKFNRIVRGMAYPYCACNDKIISLLPALGVDYARTTVSTHSFAIPDDWLKLNPTCHHDDERLFELAEKFVGESTTVEKKHREPWLFFVWGHSFEFEENDNWEIIEKFAKQVSGKSDVWYATCGEVYDYVKAYNSLIYSLDGEMVKNPSASPVWVEIRGKVYKISGGQTVKFDTPKNT